MDLQRLRELLSYDPNTGLFIWATQRRGKAQIGTKAGADCGTGYIVIRVDGVDYFAHRLAWFYVYGEWPKSPLDHKDTNRSNNAINNLREVTVQQNNHNRHTARGTAPTKSGKWVAHIRLNKKLIYIGLYPTEEIAHEAYIAAKKRLHPSFTGD